jgi:REP element-mobilizing transposase RayT
MANYRFDNPDGVYFVTFAVVDWVDVFTRKHYAELVLESLRYCQESKGLEIFAWCIMSNHIHLIIRRKGVSTLSDILRDFKKYTAKTIIEAIQTEPESRREWMLHRFSWAGKQNSNNTHYQFWQQDNHPEELFSDKFIQQKLQYLHENPVKAGIVDEPQYYNYSSAKDYYTSQKGKLSIVLL